MKRLIKQGGLLAVTIATITILGLIPQAISGQIDSYLDKVVLTNGSVIWGVTEMSDGSLKIFLDQNDSLLVPVSRVKSLKTGKLNPKLYLDRSTGVYHQISAGVLLGKEHSNQENSGSFHASFTSGYKFKPYLGVGLGIGLSYYAEQRHVPIFLDFQGDLLQGRITPFYQVDAGWSWADSRESLVQIERVEGGFYFKPAFGLRWHFARNTWHLQVSYVRQNSTTRFEPVDFGNGNITTTVVDRTLNRLGISTGISF